MFSSKVYNENDERNVVEECCFDNNHVNEVWNEINNNFDSFFQLFIETKAGKTVSTTKIKELQQKFGVTVQSKSKLNFKENFIEIQKEAINEFERDREKYEAIFDNEALDEYQANPPSFKSVVLKNECPIIHKTLSNRAAKELNRYRAEFNSASPKGLLDVVANLHKFGIEYSKVIYNPDKYESITKYQDLQMEEMSSDKLTYYGVIGGGIKSHMLYKIYPHLFPNRSQSALWALWYLTAKKKFGCRMDSEFLMIDDKHSITQQNYFYPYQLFSFYAYKLYKKIQNTIEQFNCKVEVDYRYVIVDCFLNYVASLYEEEINVLKTQIKEDRAGA